MFSIYRFFTTLIFPLLIVIIFIRKLIKKEDARSYKEKISINKLEIDVKNLVWIHGASIGEIKSIIPIVKYLIKKDNKQKILITSVTLSSAEIINKEFKNFENVIHNYFPVDVPFLVNNFLNKWKPKLVIFIDSEIWPNFLCEIKKRKINLILLNARITKKTYARWKNLGRFSKEIFSLFDICLAGSEDTYHNLLELKAKNVKFIGNLKYISNEDNTESLSQNIISQLNQYKVWCAASTHNGEEEMCIETHLEIKKKYKNTLTIIIPRHIERTNSIFKLCNDRGLKAQILTSDKNLNNNIEILLVNTFGDLQKYFKYCISVFVGKSMVKNLETVGGQNPIEAALKGCKIYHGPYVYNFQEVYKYLEENKISKTINNSKELSENIISDLQGVKNTNIDNIKKIETYGKNIFKNTIKELENFL